MNGESFTIINEASIYSVLTASVKFQNKVTLYGRIIDVRKQCSFLAMSHSNYGHMTICNV